jgi:hypothetical protein
VVKHSNSLSGFFKGFAANPASQQLSNPAKVFRCLGVQASLAKQAQPALRRQEKLETYTQALI